jgi:hypothetical protein
MSHRSTTAILLALTLCSAATAADEGQWWNPDWRFRTTVTRSTPWRDDTPRPVEAAIDFAELLERAGIAGRFDPGSLRVVERGDGEVVREAPFASRAEFDARASRTQSYLTWIAKPKNGEVGAYDIYFDTVDRGLKRPDYKADLLPPENLATNPSFEHEAGGLPKGWSATPKELVRLGRFTHSTGQRSLQVVVDESTPERVGREVTVSQNIDVRQFAGQEMVFECDLLAESAAYGAPVSIELEQSRADGSRILEYAVEPRWLTIELAEGQLVQFSERGRFSPEAATVNVKIRMRCSVHDADTRRIVTGPESFFTVWMDRIVIRPGERWAWPAEAGAGFVEGALEQAPLNRGFQFSGGRRLAFNGASEGDLTAGRFNPNPRAVHWGLEKGTLEFWCRPIPGAGHSGERIFFDSVAYGHRLQSRLQQRFIDGKSQLEFMIADAGGKLRTVRGPAALQEGRNHHIAATWDFPKAHLQLFVDGKLITAEGPHDSPWPSSQTPDDPAKRPGIGIMETDRRSMPMQAFIGGDKDCRQDRGAEGVLDEFRISDVVRYQGSFVPSRREFAKDQHTRALFHFENERHGIHDSDDRFVRGHLACELPRQQEQVPLDTFEDGRIQRRMVPVKPHAPDELFEKNRVENRLMVTRPQRELPDPRFVEYRPRQVERTVTLNVGGDYEPLMRSVTFERAEGAADETTLLPRWRANENVVPFSVEGLAATPAADVTDDAEKALEVMRYALAISNYYDAHFCETLPTRHRDRVSYTLLKAVNIYAFDQCGPLNHTLRKLFLAAGISSNDASGTHHQFEQAFYGGQWRLFDLSPRKYWLNRDNASVAGRRTFEDDLYLKLRQGDGVTSGLPGRVSRAGFGSAERPHSMDFALRPDERAGICWHNEGRWFEVTRNRQPIPLGKVPPYFGNGAVVYEPTGSGEATLLENAEFQDSAGDGPSLRATNAAEPAALIYRACCPYIFSDATVSGVYAAGSAGAVKLCLSFDEGKNWTEVWQSPPQSGAINASLLEYVTGRYAYWLKVELAAGSGATIGGLRVRTTLVASPLALPGRLSRGENRITFVGGPVSVPVTSTCRWTERYQSDLGVSLSTISYYLNGDEAHRNLLVVKPGGELPVKVALEGRFTRGEVSLKNLPEGWTIHPDGKVVESGPAGSAGAEFVLRPVKASEGDVEAFDVVVGGTSPQRRVTAQVLVTRAALVCEAEQADEIEGDVAATDIAELSGTRGMLFRGNGRLVFHLQEPCEGTCALWLRARWEPDSSTAMTLTLGDGKVRELRATAMIGFTDWTDPRYAHTKMFAHFGEQYGHWAWYRIPDVTLTADTRQLTLGAQAGACFDALLVLPQDPAVDRAAMNLLQNWNYSPWNNPL